MSNLDYFLEKVPANVLLDNLDSTMGKLWAMFSTQLDNVDFAIGQMKILLMIQQNFGNQLDEIGKLIGQGRNGNIDSVYKILLEVATVDEEVDFDNVVTIIIGLMQGDDTQIDNAFPAGCDVRIRNASPLVTNAELKTVIDGLWKFARRYAVITDDGVNAFAFDGSEGDTFGDSTNLSIGGVYADVVYS